MTERAASRSSIDLDPMQKDHRNSLTELNI
jgi:hypothetical protein